MSRSKKTYSKIFAAKPYEDVKSSYTKYVYELRDKTVANFVYNFLFLGQFCFVSFIVNFTFFALESSGKLATICSSTSFSINYQLLSLSNESMTSLTYTKSLAYPKSHEFKTILYTTRSINGEKDDYHLIFHFLNTSFCSTHCVFNSYIFVTGGNDYQQKASYGINNFTVHYPHVS